MFEIIHKEHKEYHERLRFRYRILDSYQPREKRLTIKGLLKLRNSGNNGYWEVFYGNQWQPNISMNYSLHEPDIMRITIHVSVRML